MIKQELMKELLDRYQQLDSLEGCKSAKDTVVLYIRKLELKLKEMLQEENEWTTTKRYSI